MDRGALKIFAEDLREFGRLERLYILLEGGGATELIEAAQGLRKSLSELEIRGEKAFRRVCWGMESHVQQWEGILSLYLYHPQLYLSEQEVEKFKGKLAEENILTEVRKTKVLLMSYLSPGWRYLILNDPIALREFFFAKWKGGSPWAPSFIEGYLISPNGKALFMMAEPSFPSDAWRSSHELIQRLEGLKGAFPRVRVSFVGPHTMMVRNAGILRQDLLISFLFSFVVVMTLFYLSYRRIVTLLFVGFPLLVGVQLTMGVASLFTRGLNLITVSFAAIIVGLGVDFAIHIYHRYHHERAEGTGLDEALEIALTRTGKGVWTGGLTTIASFLTLLLARIQGIVELGILVAAGLFFCLVATSLVLPSFLVWVEKREYHYRPLGEWGLGHLLHFTKANYSKILIVLLSLAVIGVFIGTKVRIIGGVEGMRPHGVEGMKVLERIREKFGGEGRGMTVLLQGKDLNHLLREQEAIASSLTNEYGGGILSISHLAQFVPSTDRQERILEMLRKGTDYEKTRNSLEGALEREAMSPDAFALTLEMLSRMAHAETTILPAALVEKLGLTPLAGVIKRYVAQEDGAYKLRQEIRFNPEKVDPLKLKKVIIRITPRAQCTGIELIAHQLQGMVKRDFTILAPLALSLVIVLLFFHFTRPLWVGMALTPLLTGVAYLLGASYLLGMELNPANAVAIPLIIGIGIDDGVHIIHRFRIEGEKNIGKVLRTTGKAVMLTSLTTMIGFGSLAFSMMKGYQQFGLALFTGIGLLFLFSVLILPVLIKITFGKRRRI